MGGAQNIAVAEGVAVVAESDTVYGIAVSDGAIRWRFSASAPTDLGDAFAGGGTAYFGTRDHRVYAVSLAHGAEQWTVDVGSDWPFLGVVRGVVRSGDTLYVAVTQQLDLNGSRERGHVVALDATNGLELWRSSGEGEFNTVSSAPRVVDNLLLVADLLGGFFAVDRFAAREVWRVRTAAPSFGALHAPVARNGVVYAGAQGGVYAVGQSDGVLRWKREDLVGATDVAFCGDVLLVQNLTIQVLDSRNGRSLGSMLMDPVDFPTSDLAVDGDEAFVIGNIAAYAFVCR